MEFLGNLGIDIKLLIAQMVNFGLLLWLLAKFLYKPIIKRIEKDETQLQEAQAQKKELETEKKAFEEQKEKETAELKRRAVEIIEEAEHVAEKIKKEAWQKSEKEASSIIKQSRMKLESLKPDIEKAIFQKMKVGISESFKKIFNDTLSLPAQRECQNVFWADLVGQIKKLEINKFREPKLAEIAKKIRKTEKQKEADKGGVAEKLERIFASKIGPVVIEYTHPFPREQEKELEKILLKKTGTRLKIAKKQNEDIINGFRFEIAGTVIESNLLNIIENATDFVQH